MRAEIKELHQRLKTTTIYVTHDQIEAMTMADRIVVMRDGSIDQVGEAAAGKRNSRNGYSKKRVVTETSKLVWGRKYPAIAQSWRRNWEHVIPFFAFPVAVRRIIYTTNAIESLNAKLRRAVRTRGHFPTDEAAIKLLYLVLRQVAQTWKMPPREWCEAKTQFAIMFDDRFVKA